MISNHTPRYFISRPLSLIIFQLSETYHFFFLYSSVQGPTTKVGPIGLRHFEFKLHPLLRSYYEIENFFFCSGRGQFYERPRVYQPSGDHQGQVSNVDTCRSSTAENGPQGPRSANRAGAGTAVPYALRAISWRARVGEEPEASPVWSLASATSAA
jgi:hypothetical protein